MNWDTTLLTLLYIIVNNLLLYAHCDSSSSSLSNNNISNNSRGIVMSDGIDPSLDTMDSKYNISINSDNVDKPVLELHTAESCVDFPLNCDPDEAVDCWMIPNNVTLTLDRCKQNSDNHRIEILNLTYIRPNQPGDFCSSDPKCYKSSCCCRKYTNNCSISVNDDSGLDSGTFGSMFGSVSRACNNESACSVTLLSVMMEKMAAFQGTCGLSGCNSELGRIQRCWARVVQVHYHCHAPVVIPPPDGGPAGPDGGDRGGRPGDPTTVHPATKHSHISMGILLGISIPAGTVIVILVITILLLCISKRKTWGAKKSPTALTHMEFSTLHPDPGSTLHLCQNEGETPHSNCQATGVTYTLTQDSSTLKWQYPTGNPCSSLLKQPLPPTPDMVENNYYEGTGALPSTSKGDIEMSSNDNKLPPVSSDNLFDGIASACSAIGYDINAGGACSNDYYDDNLRMPLNKQAVDKENKENFMIEKLAGKDMWLDGDNNNQLHIDNIYETIPETGFKGGVSADNDNKNRPAKYQTSLVVNLENNSGANAEDECNKGRGSKNNTLSPDSDYKSRRCKDGTISKVEVDLPLIPPSDRTLKARNLHRHNRDGKPLEDNYTYTYGHFSKEGRNRQPDTDDKKIYSN